MQLGSQNLSDEEFLAAVRTCSYAIEDFRHADHLRLGWILLRTMDAKAASDEAAQIIRRFGLHFGKGHAYHETVTRAWMQLLSSHHESSFDEFLLRNQARISGPLLNEFWRSETLNSAQARSEWVEPDIKPLPA